MAPWTVARQAPLSMEFSRQEYWNGLPLPPPGDLSNPGIEPLFLASSALQVDSLPLGHYGSPAIIMLRRQSLSLTWAAAASRGCYLTRSAPSLGVCLMTSCQCSVTVITVSDSSLSLSYSPLSHSLLSHNTTTPGINLEAAVSQELENYSSLTRQT